MPQYFTSTDYLLSLPIVMLTLFALWILLTDLLLPPEWKWVNAATAFAGVWGVIFVQLISGHDPGLSRHTTAATVATSSSSAASSSSASSSASTGSPSTSSGSTTPVTTSQS